MVAGMVVIFPIALHHRLKSMASGEKLDRRAEGLFILMTLRPVALLRMLGLVAYLLNPAWMAWSAVELPLWLRWLGVGVGVTAGTLLIVVMRSLGTNLTDTVVTREHHTLVTSGPYRWVLHGGRTGHHRGLARDGELVPRVDRRGLDRAARDADRHRGTTAHRAVRRRVHRLHGAYG